MIMIFVLSEQPNFYWLDWLKILAGTGNSAGRPSRKTAYVLKNSEKTVWVERYL
jgi:hypothetical protein